MIAIEKAYQLRAIGGKEVYDQLDKIHKKFADIRDVKKLLNEQLANVKDTEEYKKLAAQLKEVQSQYNKLQKEIEKLQNTEREQAIHQKQAADQAKRDAATKIADAKALTEAAKAATEAQKQATQQSIQGLNAERTAAAALQKDLKQLQLSRAQARSQQPAAAPGSYNDVAAQYKAALSGYKATVSLQDAAALDMAQKHLMSLKTQLDSFNRSLTEDKVLIGEYTSGIMKAFQKMGLGSLITDQVNTAKSSLHTLNTEFGNLKLQLEQIRTTGVGSLDAIERQLIENRQAAMQLQGQLDHVQQEMRGMGGIGTQVTQALGEEFKNLKQSIAQFIIGYLGFQQVISGIRSSIHINYELSDSFADIKNRIKGTEEEVNSLVESLKRIDTRSSLSSLVDIAAIVAKKGVAKEEISGITQAIDSLMVSLNGEMGDAKETVSTLVKLVNVYSEDKHVTADNINAIGGAIAALSNSGVATGPFLVDFAERLAGIRGVTGITIDKVLGLGAALEELGQRSEVSSTALSQIVIKLFSEAPKYAKIAGMETEHYLMMLQDDVLGMFTNIAEKLKGNTTELEAFFDNATDMHLKGARAISVIGDIAGNIDYARKRMHDATVAIHQNGIVADMAATKQQNLAANVDKLKKSLELLAASEGARATISAMVSVLKALIDNIGYVSVALLLFNARLILTKAQLAINIVWTKLYTTAMGLMLDVTVASTAGLSGLWAVMATNPMTMVIGLAALLYASFSRFNSAVTGTTDALKEKNKQMIASNDITIRATGLVSEEISRLKILNQTLLSNAVSYATKAAALDELKSKYPEYDKILSAETAKVGDLAEAYKAVEKQIRKNAELRAAQDLVKEKQQEEDSAIKLRQKIEGNFMEQSGNTGDWKGKRYISGFSEEEKKLLESAAQSVFKKYKGKKQDIQLPSWLTDEFLIYSEEAYGPLTAELNKIIDQKNKAVELYASKAIKPKAMGAFSDDRVNARSEAEGQIRIQQKLRSNFGQDSSEYGQYTKRIQGYLKDWYSAGGRSPESIYKDLEKVDADIRNAKDKTTLDILRMKRGSLTDELTNSLELHDNKNKTVRMGKGPDSTNAEVKSDTDLSKYKSNILQQALRREMDGQKEVYENEQESLFKRLGAYSQFVSLQGMLADEQNNAEINAVQIKLNKIEAIEEAKKKKAKDRTAEEAAYFDKFGRLRSSEAKLLLEKPALLAEIDSINATIKTKQEATAREVQKTYANILVGGMNTLLDATSKDIDAALNESYGRAAEMRRKIYDSNMSPFRKGKKLGKLEMDTVLEDDKLKIQGNERMQQVVAADLMQIEQDAKKNKNLLGAEIAFQDKLKALKAEKTQLEDKYRVDKYNKDLSEAEQQQQLYDTIRDGAINTFQQISSAYMTMMQQQSDIDMQRQQRALDWSRKTNEAHAQSLQEKQGNELAFQKAQEEMERRRLEKNKQMAITQMTIDYGVGVMKIWSAKALVTPIAIAETAALSAVYFGKLAMMNSQKFEQGGILNGGVFGGKSHANGGSKFSFGGSIYEAEADELAIINKRSAASNATMTVTGTPRQIASRVNAAGGGVDFAPGASSWSGRGVGWMAEHSRVPSFITSHYMGRGLQPMSGGGSNNNSEVLQSIIALKDHVHNIQVQLNPHQVAGFNDNYKKSVNVGMI